MKNEFVGFRTEAYSGSGVRDLSSVLQYEVVVSQNIDCLKTCFDYIRHTDFGRKVGSVLSLIEKNDNRFGITLLPKNYQENNGKPFFDELVSQLSKEMNMDLKYGLWLADRACVMGSDKFRIYNGTSNNSDMYIQGPVSLCDTGDNGTLFAYPYNPMPMDVHDEVFVKREIRNVLQDKIPLDKPGMTIEMRAKQTALLLKEGVRLDNTWQIGTDKQILLGNCLIGKESVPVWEQLAVLARNDESLGRVVVNDSEFFMGTLGKQVETSVWQGLCDNHSLKNALSIGLKWMGQTDLSVGHLNNLLDFYDDSKTFLLLKTKEGFTFLPLGSSKVSYEEKFNYLENLDVNKIYFVSREDGIRLVDKPEAHQLLKNASRDFVSDLSMGDILKFKDESYLCSVDKSFLKLSSKDELKLERPFVRISSVDMATRLDVQPCLEVIEKAVSPTNVLKLCSAVERWENNLMVVLENRNRKKFVESKQTNRIVVSNKNSTVEKTYNSNEIIR